MMELTKERLQQIVHAAGLEPWDYEEVFDGITTGEIVMMARRLLAGLEQEPVGITDRSEIEGLKRGEMANVMPPNFKGVDAGDEVLLYAAPQLPHPSVPDEIQKLKDGRGFKYVKDGVHYSVNYANGWNHCRAAMLQGAEPVSQPYTLRDGWVAVPVEPTEDMVIAGFEAELREEFRDPEAWEEFEAMSGCEQAATRAKWCWAAMIAAAPQQEALNRIQEERVKIQEEMSMGARLTKHRFKVK